MDHVVVLGECRLRDVPLQGYDNAISDAKEC